VSAATPAGSAAGSHVVYWLLVQSASRTGAAAGTTSTNPVDHRQLLDLHRHLGHATIRLTAAFLKQALRRTWVRNRACRPRP